MPHLSADQRYTVLLVLYTSRFSPREASEYIYKHYGQMILPSVIYRYYSKFKTNNIPKISLEQVCAAYIAGAIVPNPNYVYTIAVS